MPFLKQQIELINSHLLQTALSDKRFQGGRLEAIAVDVSRTISKGKTETFPAIMNANYEPQEITPDDNYPITIYHKVLNKKYSSERSAQGDDNKRMLETVELNMVVFGKYAALKLSAEQLEALITTNFPGQMAKSKITDLQLNAMKVTLLSSTLDSSVIFKEEYKGFELFLAPEDILFSIRYEIQTKFCKGCFAICEC